MHLAPELFLLWWLCMGKSVFLLNGFCRSICHSAHTICVSAHAFWAASGIPWQMKHVLIDWAAGTQHCKDLFKHLYPINSSLFVKLSGGKPVWHLAPNLYRKAQSLAGGQFTPLLEGKSTWVSM